MDGTDTMHALIKEYRKERKVLLNIENKLINEMAPQFPSLTAIQKVRTQCGLSVCVCMYACVYACV
jgi:phosphatidylinositol kinase/protein kinase (PI-3  family)